MAVLMPWATGRSAVCVHVLTHKQTHTKRRDGCYVFLQVHEFRSRLQPKTPLRGRAPRCRYTHQGHAKHKQKQIQPKEQPPSPSASIHPPIRLTQKTRLDKYANNARLRTTPSRGGEAKASTKISKKRAFHQNQQKTRQQPPPAWNGITDASASTVSPNRRARKAQRKS